MIAFLAFLCVSCSMSVVAHATTCNPPCSTGSHCELVDVATCNTPPCGQQPSCVPDDPCLNHKCGRHQRCELRNDECSKPPCKAQPHCVDESCRTVTCPQNQECEMKITITSTESGSVIRVPECRPKKNHCANLVCGQGQRCEIYAEECHEPPCNKKARCVSGCGEYCVDVYQPLCITNGSVSITVGNDCEYRNFLKCNTTADNNWRIVSNNACSDTTITTMEPQHQRHFVASNCVKDCSKAYFQAFCITNGTTNLTAHSQCEWENYNCTSNWTLVANVPCCLANRPTPPPPEPDTPPGPCEETCTNITGSVCISNGVVNLTVGWECPLRNFLKCNTTNPSDWNIVLTGACPPPPPPCDSLYLPPKGCGCSTGCECLTQTTCQAVSSCAWVYGSCWRKAANFSACNNCSEKYVAPLGKGCGNDCECPNQIACTSGAAKVNCYWADNRCYRNNTVFSQCSAANKTDKRRAEYVLETVDVAESSVQPHASFSPLLPASAVVALSVVIALVAVLRRRSHSVSEAPSSAGIVPLDIL